VYILYGNSWINDVSALSGSLFVTLWLALTMCLRATTVLCGVAFNLNTVPSLLPLLQ